MKILIHLFIALALSLNPGLAFKLGDIIKIADSQVNQYPEVENRLIHFHTGSSPLAALENPEDHILRSTELSKQTLERTFTLAAANKIIGLADGFINVKYQVQDGVNNALKDTFIGFFEYQRRKTSEEILNSNLKAHIDCVNFLNQDLEMSSANNPLSLINRVFSLSIIQEIFLFLKKLSLSLFILIIMFKILNVLINKTQKDNSEIGFDKVFRHSLVQLSLLILLEVLWDWIFKAFRIISEGIINILNNDDPIFSFFYNHEDMLIESWTAILNLYGYFPALILAFVDSIAQFIFIMSFLSSILLIILVKTFSPLVLIMPQREQISLNIFFYAILLLSSLSLLPLAHSILYKILSEISFNSFGHFIYISFSILSLLFLSLIQGFFIFKFKKF